MGSGNRTFAEAPKCEGAIQTSADAEVAKIERLKKEAKETVDDVIGPGKPCDSNDAQQKADAMLGRFKEQASQQVNCSNLADLHDNAQMEAQQRAHECQKAYDEAKQKLENMVSQSGQALGSISPKPCSSQKQQAALGDKDVIAEKNRLDEKAPAEKAKIDKIASNQGDMKKDRQECAANYAANEFVPPSETPFANPGQSVPMPRPRPDGLGSDNGGAAPQSAPQSAPQQQSAPQSSPQQQSPQAQQQSPQQQSPQGGSPQGGSPQSPQQSPQEAQKAAASATDKPLTDDSQTAKTGTAGTEVPVSKALTPEEMAAAPGYKEIPGSMAQAAEAEEKNKAAKPAPLAFAVAGKGKGAMLVSGTGSGGLSGAMKKPEDDLPNNNEAARKLANSILGGADSSGGGGGGRKGGFSSFVSDSASKVGGFVSRFFGGGGGGDNSSSGNQRLNLAGYLPSDSSVRRGIAGSVSEGQAARLHGPNVVLWNAMQGRYKALESTLIQDP